jgi:hypothetical protein
MLQRLENVMAIDWSRARRERVIGYLLRAANAITVDAIARGHPPGRRGEASNERRARATSELKSGAAHTQNASADIEHAGRP